MAKGDFDTSQVPQLRVIHLLSPNLLACNGQGEKILPVLLLMADLNSGPFSKLWQLADLQKCPSLCLIVVPEDTVEEDNIGKAEA